MKITDKKDINLKLVKKFIDYYDYESLSGADIIYGLHTWPEVKEESEKVMKDYFSGRERDVEFEKMINEAQTPEELVNIMRKPMNMPLRSLLTEKLLKKENEVLPLIKEKSLRNSSDYFIESTVEFLLCCKTNCSDWIVENYSAFRCEYMKALLCLVLGFRGEVGLIPWLMDETERFGDMCSKDELERGPALAVMELYNRFLRK